MTEQPKNDRVTIGAIAAGALAVGCCAGLPLAAGAIAAIGALAFGGIAAFVLLVLLAVFAWTRRRRHRCIPASPQGPS